ncbi:MAG TPA: hypothetical protein VIN39_05120 [Candidatus Dormibacteraeota bacterium]
MDTGDDGNAGTTRVRKLNAVDGDGATLVGKGEVERAGRRKDSPGRIEERMLKAAAQSVSIRNFRAAVAPQTATLTATLAQTGGGVPLAPIGLGLAGLLLAAMGTRLLVARR